MQTNTHCRLASYIDYKRYVYYMGRGNARLHLVVITFINPFMRPRLTAGCSKVEFEMYVLFMNARRTPAPKAVSRSTIMLHLNPERP